MTGSSVVFFFKMCKDISCVYEEYSIIILFLFFKVIFISSIFLMFNHYVQVTGYDAIKY